MSDKINANTEREGKEVSNITVAPLYKLESHAVGFESCLILKTA